MHRSALVAALVVALPTFADEDSERTEPAATFAAEGVVQRVMPQLSDDGVDWAEVTFKLSRCIAGPCTPHQSMKVRVAFSQWRGKHGQTMGLVRYEWKDGKGDARAWAMAHRLDDADENERFEIDCEKAVATVGAPVSDSAVATR